MKFKKRKIIITTIIVTVIALAIIINNVFSIKTNEIKLKVVDSVTEEPLNNIKIYYKAMTSRIDNKFGFPILDPILYENRIYKEFKTDKDGCVIIPEYKIDARLYEKLLRISININLDMNSSFVKSKYESDAKTFYENSYQRQNNIKFINPNEKYKGVYLVIPIYKENPDDYDSTEFDEYKMIIDSEGLKKGNLNYIIKLEPYK